MSKNVIEKMTPAQSRALAAVMFHMIGASEVLFFDLEAYYLAHGFEFKHETKKLFNEFMETAKRMHKQYGRMTRYAISCANSPEMDAKDAYEIDTNAWARTGLQIYDALYGHDEQALLQIESMLKLIAKQPMFGSEIYNRYVPDIEDQD